MVGGVITELVGWRTLYWMNLPLAAALLAGVLINAPGPPGSRGTRLDVAGAATLTASIMAVVAGASLLEHPAQRPLGAAALVLGAVLLVAFIAVERRAAHPLLPADAVRHPRLRFAAGASALNTATTSAAATLATLYLHNERGLGATATGLLLLPFSVCVVAGSTAATPLLRRQPPRASIALGLTTIATGIAILLALPLTVALLPAAFAIAGLGIGISSVAANTLGTDLPPDLQGVATGALNTAAQLGTRTRRLAPRTRRHRNQPHRPTTRRNHPGLGGSRDCRTHRRAPRPAHEPSAPDPARRSPSFAGEGAVPLTLR